MEMQKKDKLEERRRDMRNNLEELVNKERKPGGSLAEIDDPEFIKKLNFVKTWHQGSTEDYEQALNEVTQYIVSTKKFILD